MRLIYVIIHALFNQQAILIKLEISLYQAYYTFYFCNSL